MVVPQMPGGRLGVDQDTPAHRSKRDIVKVKGAIEELPCGDLRVECRLLQEIESEFSLWEEEIPKVWGKGWIHSGQDGKVVLEKSKLHAQNSYGNACQGGLLETLLAMRR
jgi:hypothetical protein